MWCSAGERVRACGGFRGFALPRRRGWWLGAVLGSRFGVRRVSGFGRVAGPEASALPARRRRRRFGGRALRAVRRSRVQSLMPTGLPGAPVQQPAAIEGRAHRARSDSASGVQWGWVGWEVSDERLAARSGRGGTSTRAVLVDAAGEVRGRGTAAGANPAGTDPDAALAALATAVRAALATRDPATVTACLIGLAGYRSLPDPAEFAARCRSALQLRCPVRVVPDAVPALAAGACRTAPAPC